MADALIILVAAMTRSRVIAKNNKLPWRIKEEGEHYLGLVKGKTIIVGRRTFELMKKPIPGSHLIVLSGSNSPVKGAEVFKTLDGALARSKKYGDDVYVIGGANVFSETIGIADKMCLSYIKKNYEGDKFFPEINMDQWMVESREDFPEFEYVVYLRKW